MLLWLTACSGSPPDSHSATPQGAHSAHGAHSAPDAHTGATDSGTAHTCVDPVAVLSPAGAATGVVRCADGSFDRPSSPAADPTVSRAACTRVVDSGLAGQGECDAVTPCVDGSTCVAGRDVYGTRDDDCRCARTCTTDADCDTDEACLSALAGPGVPAGVDEWPRCVPASCRTDADCPSGECGLSFYGRPGDCDSIVEVTLRCRTTDDACRAVCGEDEQCYGPDDGSAWHCVAATDPSDGCYD